MKTICFLIALIAVATSLQAEIYKWTDNDGNIHFSDKTHLGAETVQIPPVQVYSQPPKEIPAIPVMQKKTNAATEYNSIEFLQPVDLATVRDNQGNVAVNINVDPALDANDFVQLLLDGTPIGKPQNTISFQLKRVNRGSHSLQAQVSNAQGVVLKSSDSITIYLHKTRMGHGG